MKSTSEGGPSIVTDGLVLHLDAANPKSYPGSGTVWKDLSGNGLNGTLTNGPTYNSDNNGSLVFDGVDDYVLVDTPFQSTLSVTKNIWVYQNSNERWDSGYASNNSRFHLGYDVGNQQGLFGLGSTYIFSSNIGTLTTGKWYMFTLVGSNSTCKIYLNGNMKDSFNYGTGNMSSTMGIGARIGQYSASNINGNISSTQIYNKALTQQEVLQNYNATKSRFNL